jgi:accessory colonization factor AcfC
MSRRSLSAIVLLAFCAVASAASAAEIRVLTPGGAAPAVKPLAEQFTFWWRWARSCYR